MSIAIAAARLLPERLRHSLIRSRMKFSDRDLDDVVVKLAESPDEALAASHIVHRAYARRGLVAPHPTGLRVTPHSVVPTTHTFVAMVGDRYVGTMSLIGDGVLGLPLEGVYASEVAALRGAGERLAEVGSLAILPSFRRKGIVCLLYRAMYEVAIATGVHRLVVAVHPKAEDLYRATLLFRRFGDERHYAGLNRSARAVALELDLRDAEARMRSAFGDMPKTTANPLYVYVESERPELRVPPAGAIGEGAREAMARALVAARPDVFGALPWTARAELRAAVPSLRFTMPEIETTAAPAWTLALARMVPA
jgi:ribosomal protein S18 acetylase RimI-like enzyme